mmetsp:Transcript_34500/g.62544  ORF Transcript_34500/g.62544 Transcript_34500/m.62544 type:complete len:262 (+) Transcript_34500:2629-3414(+)
MWNCAVMHGPLVRISHADLGLLTRRTRSPGCALARSAQRMPTDPFAAIAQPHAQTSHAPARSTTSCLESCRISTAQAQNANFQLTTPLAAYKRQVVQPLTAWRYLARCNCQICQKPFVRALFASLKLTTRPAARARQPATTFQASAPPTLASPTEPMHPLSFATVPTQSVRMTTRSGAVPRGQLVRATPARRAMWRRRMQPFRPARKNCFALGQNVGRKTRQHVVMPRLAAIKLLALANTWTKSTRRRVFATALVATMTPT